MDMLESFIWVSRNPHILCIKHPRKGGRCIPYLFLHTFSFFCLNEFEKDWTWATGKSREIHCGLFEFKVFLKVCIMFPGAPHTYRLQPRMNLVALCVWRTSEMKPGHVDSTWDMGGFCDGGETPKRFRAS